MPKYKLYYPDKEYNKKDNILFVNYYTDKHLNIIKNYLNKTILYDCKNLFFSKLDKIRKIYQMKINIISFDADIQIEINKIKNQKKEIIGILSSNLQNINFITELEKVYDIDFSENSEYFMNKSIPLCIVDIKNTPEYNKLLETRTIENTNKTFIIQKNCEDILLRLFLKNYWDFSIDFINIYKNCYFSKKIQPYLKDEICKKYKLIEKIGGPIIYFTDFNIEDCGKILNYNNIIFLIWLKVEQLDKINLIRKKNNIIHFASNKFLLKNLQKYLNKIELFEINIDTPKIFKPIEKKGSKILLCDSHKYYNELLKILPEYEFLFSNKYDLNNPNIAEELYRKCFIVLCLTDFKEFLPMVNELKAMNIPLVHNYSDYGLKWKTNEDIKAHIFLNSPPIIQYKHQYSFDLMKNIIKNENLEMIYNNLDEICRLIGKYKNILFISNKDDKTIVDFIKKNNQEIYLKFIICKEFNGILKFSPDIIIVKGDCDIDIYKYFNVPTIFLVDDLFTDNDSNNFINKNVIEKIEKYDVSFVNSQHINEILKKFGIICKFFYWDFIPYYGKEILNNNNRKYDYGIIKGSNVDQIFSKKIIIDNIFNIQKNLYDIKYIVYESSYDALCQLKVDILMNGCMINIPNCIIFQKQNRIKFKKGQEYIIKFEGSIITEKLVYGISFIEGMNDKEFIIYYYAEDDLEIDELDFIKMHKINYEIIGYNPVCLNSQDIEYLYYIYGSINNEEILAQSGLTDIFNYYSSELKTKKYNAELLKRKWCYDLGKNGKILDMSDFSEFVLKYSNNIISRKCLVISKKINGHGGNQKTAMQLIGLLEKYFIVEILSNNMNQKEYNFISDSIDSRIHNMKIIKKKIDKEIIDHINKNNYQFIINNKLNDYFRICSKIIHSKLYVISHNSMDPFNELIIQNQNYISKVFTINKFHQDVLTHHGLRIPQAIFYNYVEKENYELKRTKFKNRIGFIGRFSKEKNLKLLIACMKKLEGIELINIELIVIGGENETGEENKNIIWKGVLQKDEIISELRECDYLVVPSTSEGLPFVILEAMNIGIPCIYSRIIGSDQLIGVEGERGFTFELEGYENCKMKMDWSVFEEVDAHFEKNVTNICNCIFWHAYSISIIEWNKISKNCKKFIKKKYFENKTNEKNIKSLEIIL